MNEVCRTKRNSCFFGLHLALIVPSVLLFLMSAGCSDSTPSLIIHPVDNSRPLVATFTRALWFPDQSGEDQVVMVNDPIDTTSAPDSGDPLPPARIPPIRQMLVIHLQWRKAISMRTDTPASTNAVLNWYVFGGGVAGIIHYSGSAYVSIASHSSHATVEIHHASLKLVEKTGPLQDPLGAFTADGKGSAINSPAQFQLAMKDLYAAQAEARQSIQSPSSAPTTRPTTLPGSVFLNEQTSTCPRILIRPGESLEITCETEKFARR